MGIFGKKISKEEKQRLKEEKIKREFDFLVEKFQPFYGKYCKYGDYIFIFRGFDLEDGKILIRYIDDETLTGYISRKDYYWFCLRYEKTIDRAYYDWLEFVQKLKRINLNITQNEI